MPTTEDNCTKVVVTDEDITRSVGNLPHLSSLVVTQFCIFSIMHLFAILIRNILNRLTFNSSFVQRGC